MQFGTEGLEDSTRIGWRARDVHGWRAPLVNAMLKIQGGERRANAVQTFGRAEKHQPVWVHAKLEHLQEPFSCLRVEIDQQVAAGNQVHPGKGWVLHHVMDGQEHYPAE